MKIPVDKIKVPEERARASYSEEQGAFLEASMSKYGQLSEILVRPTDNDEFELIDGESRLKQLVEAGAEEIECRVVDLNDKDANMVNILMNIARGTQDPMGTCLAFTKAKDSGMTEEEIAVASGHSVAWVKFMLMLGDLPEIYQEALQRGDLKVGHIREVFRLPEPKEIDAALSTTLRQGLKVNVLKTYVDNRTAELSIAKKLREQYGVEAPPPVADPQRLTRTVQCLACNEMVDRNDVNLPRICTPCYTLLKYITQTVGTGNEAMQTIYKALQLKEAYDRQQSQFLTDQMVQQRPAPAIVPNPQPEAIPKQSSDVIIKPADMDPKAFEELKEQLKRLYSG